MNPRARCVPKLRWLAIAILLSPVVLAVAPFLDLLGEVRDLRADASPEPSP